MQSSKVIYIPKGSIKSIIAYLNRTGHTLSVLDEYMLRFIGVPQHGWIDIGSKNLSRFDFLYALTHSKAHTIDIMLIPGETTVMFFEQIAKKLSLDSKKLYRLFLEYSPIKEGVIIPETYSLPYEISEEQAVRLLLNRSIKLHSERSRKIFGEYLEKKWFQYVTIASIIEKEAASKDEMPIISSVIYNRLKKRMRLQMDGTLNYGRYSHIKVTSKRIKTDKSTYNTYKYAGIPPSPVCNVSFEAIKAAIYPKKTKYLYFVKSKNGSHTFSRYYNSHLRHINRH